jgi:hypothetical protein
MRLPHGCARPVIFLLLVAPLITEVLFGTTTITGFAGYFAQIGLYGGGALLIREVARRWGAGWPSILLLGAAYGAIEEGLLEPTWFTPQLQTHPYGVAFGVFWTYAAFNVGYHAVFSITLPILLTELVFPQWRDKPWLSGAGLAVIGGVYVVNAAAIGLLWWTFLQNSVYHVPAMAHPVQQGATVVLIIALVAAARLATRARTSAAGGPPPPAAARLAAAAALSTLAWFGLLLASASADYLHWLPFPILIVAAAAGVTLAARALRHWSARTDLQVLAVCSGALVVQMAAGFGVAGLDGPVNIIGKAILNIVAVCVLARFALRLYRDLMPAQPRPATARPLQQRAYRARDQHDRTMHGRNHDRHHH